MTNLLSNLQKRRSQRSVVIIVLTVDNLLLYYLLLFFFVQLVKDYWVNIVLFPGVKLIEFDQLNRRITVTFTKYLNDLSKFFVQNKR